MRYRNACRTRMSKCRKKYYNDFRDVYFGELSESGKRHGKGTYLFANGAK